MRRLAGAALLVCGALSAVAQPGATATAESSGSGSDYTPITSRDRLTWVIGGTIGTRNLAAGLFTSGWGTLKNSPEEWGPHWDGFGKRYGWRLVAGATTHTMEAGLGSLWGEDPRYFRAGKGPVKTRLMNVVKLTFLATDRNGDRMPAYARYMAITGENFLANTWQPDSHSDARHAGLRIPISFVSRLVGNTFSEFLPDATSRIFKSKK